MSETPQHFWKKLRSQADRTLGEQFWNDISGLIPNAQPRADVFQTEDRFIVVIELPGCKVDESVKLSVQKNTLHIKGDIPYRYPVEDDQLLVSERFFGQFHRKVALPQGTSAEGMRARYRDGLLTIEFVRQKQPDTVIDIAIDTLDTAPGSEPQDRE
ncbi:Hsp20/alpha crystallin family protein [Paenibacillus ginsengarvi]|uniref:Hsp20/alpha crystallin family protein n=1 Tax=Paenibacillus ginsengarvi TaxID=400777 RepID=A0A3B0CWD4_9BACL|nr:Hsp20/alpha crystallin family protein [Paenibacillus ginsengarvi]RKN86396.1 Hsp20/alpha crystallin family protein [Paenibacillus ginsengarvi]